MASAVEEQTASIADVADDANTLADAASTLRSSLENFDVDGTDGGGPDLPADRSKPAARTDD